MAPSKTSDSDETGPDAVSRRDVLKASGLITTGLVGARYLGSGSASGADPNAYSLHPVYYPLPTATFVPDIDLSGKLAVITGASRGIGRATAEVLLARGMHVIGTSRNPSTAPAANFPLLALDISDEHSVKRFAADLERRLGRNPIDLLINNGGRIVQGSLIPSAADADFYFSQQQLAIDTVYRGPIRVTQKLLPKMNPTGPASIMFTCSIASYVVGGSAGDTISASTATYYAGKASLLRYANSLRNTLAGTNITVCTVNPYFVATELCDHPRPIYLQDVRRSGFAPGPLTSPFNEYLAAVRGITHAGMHASYVGETYAQLASTSGPPPNVVVAATDPADGQQSVNALIEALLYAESQESAIRISG